MHMQPRIAIVGGGPSGLLLARLLELVNLHNYVVFERDESAVPGPGQQGGTLDLHETTGQMALKRARLFDEFRDHLARWDASCIHVCDQNGKTFIRHSSGTRPEIDRIQLRQLLLSSIPAERISWGKSVGHVERPNTEVTKANGNGCTIHFKDGTSASGFDLIVGADGTWSKIRPLITPATPRYSGKLFVEGRLSLNSPAYQSAQSLAGPGNMMALGHGKSLNVQQVADKTYRVYFGVQEAVDFASGKAEKEVSDSTATEALRDRFLNKDFYGSWATDLKQVVNHVEGPFRSWPLYRFDPQDVGWERTAASGLTLLGDAAHCSTPFAGEGVNCSMQDAVVLADAIVQHCDKSSSGIDNLVSSLDAALISYDNDMFIRGRDLIRKSMMIEEVAHRDHGAEALLELFTTMAAEQDSSK